MMPSMLLRASGVAARAACSAVSAASRRAAGAGSAGAAAMPLPRSTPVASPLFGRFLASRLAAVACFGGAAAQLLRRSPPVASPQFRRCLSSHMAPSDQDSEEFVVEDKDLESDEALWALYERWCKFFGEERSREEMQRRFDKFKDFVVLVDRFNKKAIRDGNSCRIEVNMFADGKQAEQRLMRLPMEFLDRLPYSESPIIGRGDHRLFDKKGSEREDFTNPLV